MSVPQRQREKVEQGLQAWAAFPMDGRPRPLLLLSPTVTSGPFPDGATKLAFVQGMFEAEPGFPAEVLAALRAQPTRSMIPAESLILTTATQSTKRYVTDRGERLLPAWKVYARGVPDPIWVLDPGIRKQAWWPPGTTEDDYAATRSQARLDPDERTVTLTFTGIPRAFADYVDAEVMEAGSAVAILPLSVDIGPPGIRTANAEPRQITAVLPSPLGSRVLLDGDGLPTVLRTEHIATA